MLKKFLIFLSGCMLLGYSFGIYSPTIQDQVLLDSFEKKFEQIYKENPQILINFKYKLDKLASFYNKNERLLYIISHLIKSIDKYTNTYKLLDIIDGDTIKILYKGEATNVRLIGIDTPEKSTYRYGYVECFGEEAYKYLESILSGGDVRLEFDNSQGTRDKYNRLLAYIWHKQRLINKQMIASGYAWEYTYNLPYKYQYEFKNAQKYAQTHNLGLRNPNTCNGERKEIVPYVSSNNQCYKKYCKEMTSCQEAMFYLNTCGLKRLDSDGDGIPCESICQP